jgi:hypothetical protein
MRSSPSEICDQLTLFELTFDIRVAKFHDAPNALVPRRERWITPKQITTVRASHFRSNAYSRELCADQYFTWFSSSMLALPEHYFA